MGTAEEKQLTMLDKVFTRVIGTKADKLESVLDKLLPRLLVKLSGTAAVREKTIEILQHINKRISGDKTFNLPVEALIKLYHDHSSSAFVVNFAFVYIDMGFPRLTTVKKGNLVPSLIEGVAALSEAHQRTVLRLIRTGLAYITLPPEPITWWTPRCTPEDKGLLLDYFMDILLLVHRPNMLAAPPGFTVARMLRLREKNDDLPDAAAFARWKLTVLHLLSRGVYPAEQVFCHYICGRALAARHDVAKVAEEGLVKIRKIVDVENAAMVLHASRLFFGYTSQQAATWGYFGGARSQGANEVKIGLMRSVFLVSPLAQSQVEEGYRLAKACVFGETSPVFGGDITPSDECRVLGLRFMAEVLKKAEGAEKEKGEALFAALTNRLATLQSGPLAQDAQLQQEELEETYTTIGALAQRFPKVFAADAQVVELVIKGLVQQRDVRGSVHAALGRICPAYNEAYASDGVRKRLKKLLVGNVGEKEPKLRTVTAEWCRRLFSFDDVEARFVCLILSCDEELSVREAAVKGLLPELCNQLVEPMKEDLLIITASSRYKAGQLGLVWTEQTDFAEENKLLTRPENKDSWPNFADWIAFISADTQKQVLNNGAPSKQAAVLGFSSICLSFAANQDSSSVEVYRGMVERAMEQTIGATKGGKHAEATALSILHRVASKCLVELVKASPEDYKDSAVAQPEWLLHWLKSDSQVVRENVAQLATQYPVWLDGKGTFDGFVAELVKRVGNKLVSGVAARHGAILAAGHLLTSPVDANTRGKLSAALASTITQDRLYQAAKMACIQAVGVACDASALDLPTERRKAVMERLIGFATRSLDKSASEVKSDEYLTLNVEHSLRSIGKMCASETDPELRMLGFEALVEASKHKSSEMQLIVAAALAHVGSGAWLDGDESTGEVNSLLLESHPLQYMLHRMIGNHEDSFLMSANNRLRQALAFWLLYFVSVHGAKPQVQSLLDEIQEAFALLLRERAEVTRECAARGIARTFESASPSKREALKTSLNSHLTAHKRSQMKDAEEEKEGGREDGAEGGGAGGESVKESGSLSKDLTTEYKEMFELAIRVENIELTYHLFYLSAATPIWFARAAEPLESALFESKRVTTDREFLNKLIPVLFRYKHDMLTPIRLAMDKLWRQVLISLKPTVQKQKKRKRGAEDAGRTQEVLKDFYDVVIAELLTCLSSSEVRERHSAALGMVEVLRVTEDKRAMEFLEELWSKALRLADDVSKLTTKAALLLVADVAKLTIRLCDVSSKEGVIHAERALGIALPYLLDKGLAHPAKEAAQVSMVTLDRVVTVAGDKVRPHIARCVGTLLSCMSSMEEQNLQYAMHQTEETGGKLKASKEQLELVRIAVASESVLQRTINTCMDRLRPNEASQFHELMTNCTHLLRSGVGLPTLASTAKLITRVADTRSFAELMPQHCGPLLKAYINGLQDESLVLRKLYLSSAARVAKLCPQGDAALTNYLIALVAFYYQPGDAKARVLVCEGLQAVVRSDGNILKREAAVVLPMIFISRVDDKADIGDGFQSLWLDVSDSFSLDKHLELIVDESLSSLRRTSWLNKRQGAVAIGSLVPIASQRFAPFCNDVLNVLVDLLPGNSWKGKEALPPTIAAVWNIAVRHPQQSKLTDEKRWSSANDFVKQVLLPEARRKTTSPAYRAAVITCLGGVCEAARDVDQDVSVIAEVLALLKAIVVDEKADDEVVRSAVLALGDVWPNKRNGVLQAEHLETAMKFIESSIKGTAWFIQEVAMQALSKVLHYTTLGEPLTSQYAQGLLSIAWVCVQQNKNPKVVVAATEAVMEILSLDRNGMSKTQLQILKQAATTAKPKATALLKNKDASVVHAAEKLVTQANAVIASPI